MSAEVVSGGVVSEQLLVALQRLSPDRCQQVVDFAEFLVEKMVEPVVVKPARILGLHAGQVWMSEDFDEPLPDEVWYGENDPLMISDEQLPVFNQTMLS